MTGQSKHHVHLWDNVLGSFGSNSHRNPSKLSLHSQPPRDTTGSRMNLFEYERKRTTKVTTTTTTSYDTSSKSEKVKSFRKQSHVVDCRRKRAEKPHNLESWSFVKESDFNKRYDKEAALNAFAEYGRRLKEKKMERQQPLTDMIPVLPRKVVSNREYRCKKVDVSSHKKRERKVSCHGFSRNVEITNQRDDDIKIESHKVRQESCTTSKVARKHQTAFYGTIEAEKCANKAAEHITLASDNLKRLQFITEAVFPQSKDQMELLDTVGNDVKEFNAQLKTNRFKAPTNSSTNGNHVARFVIENNQ